MSGKKLAVIILIAAGLFGIKYMFPQQTAELINSVSGLLGGKLDYRQALSDLGESISVFGEDTGIGDFDVSPQPQSRTETAQLTELACSTGERQSADEAVWENVPEAVEAFLESQKEFADLELPDSVSYDYEPFPGEYCSPVSGYNSSGFGYRLHPIRGDIRFHYGTDFAAWTGEAIHSFASGTVSFAGYCDSYGNYITIEHENGWESLYAHCSVLYVSAGDKVESGELIALVGDTGMVTGPHLHFELSRNGVYTNPEYYVG